MADKNPLVSICIPVFNRADLMWRTIESCIHQTYRNIEIVVVDNASTDNTREVVLEYARKDPRVKYFRNDTNIGGGRNFLKCVEHASGEFAQPLGSDDWLSRNYIEEGVAQFARYPDVAAILANVLTFEFQKNSSSFRFLDEMLIRPGTHSAEWFFRGIYLGGVGGTGFISLMRREDVADALRKVLENPVNLIQRAGLPEPFDMLIFLEVLARYRSFFVTKNSAYIKSIHGHAHAGLQGNFFESRAGLIRYAAALRRAFESFFIHHGLQRHYQQLRFFNGLSIGINSSAVLLGKRIRKEERTDYVLTVKDFFKDYSKKEKWLMAAGALPYIVFKFLQRFKKLFMERSVFVPDPKYFLTADLHFKAE